MRSLSSLGFCLVLSLSGASAWAETVVPLKGQSSQQIQLDINDCHNVANSTATTPPAAGGRVRGAAVGAAAGAVGAEVRGRQHDEVYDRVDDDVKQDYRQNRAKETAAAGAVVGGAHQRQERRQQRRTNETNSASAYTSCLQGKGYQVNP
ncbi:MAG: YMGG-like glycine zipper-containing protein [Pseudomonas sp.]